MGHQLRASDALTEDQDLVLSTIMAAHDHL